jgi:hypothetical protein
MMSGSHNEDAFSTEMDLARDKKSGRDKKRDRLNRLLSGW